MLSIITGKKYRLSIIFIMLIFQGAILAQEPWDNNTYPDKDGFDYRMKPMLKRIAAQGFGVRSLATSKCPDTGLPVKTWALEGETVISPFTGRAYTQGPTGYFGPKARNEKGEIISFGGDPLKYDLPPATSAFLLNEDAERAKAFMSIPGNLRQQYHFACSNWARAFPLIKTQMPDIWKSQFFKWISLYEESRKPSDGVREFSEVSHPHNLVGQEGELLGGNAFDGGTENHKTMWRTSALLYSQILPDTCKISGYTLKEAERLTKEMIRDYLKKLLYVGNGEYDSDVYYPFTIKSFMNLYDFSPDPETRQLAKFALDYFFVSYGLKVVDGAIAGAQKRGYLSGDDPDMMEIMQWGFFDDTSRDMSEATSTIHQATTTYRPNNIIWNLVRKDISLPFEAKMSRPFYHMDYPFAFAEYFYSSESFNIGNISMSIVDNPNQQMVWSAVAKGKDGPLSFSGGHPMRASTSGHSPYTQTLQSKGTLIVLTAPTKIVVADTSAIAVTYKRLHRDNLWILPQDQQPGNFELIHRQKYASAPLHSVNPPTAETPDEVARFWMESQGAATSWFYFPRQLNPILIDGVYFIEANETYLAIIPLTKDHFILNPSEELVDKLEDGQATKFFSSYGLISFSGQVSGYIVELSEKRYHQSLHDFSLQVKRNSKVQFSKAKKIELTYTSQYGDFLEMIYQPTALRSQAFINGHFQDWDNFTEGAVYDSKTIKVKNGIMEVADDTDGYRVDFTGDFPVWMR